MATGHLIVDFVRILEAFVFNAGKITANAYYSDLAAPLEYAKTILYVTQTVLADCVLGSRFGDVMYLTTEACSLPFLV
jgi:hypothetical protein